MFEYLMNSNMREFRLPIPQKLHHTLLWDFPSATNLKAIDLIGVKQLEHRVLANFEDLLAFLERHDFRYSFVHRVYLLLNIFSYLYVFRFFGLRWFEMSLFGLSRPPQTFFFCL